MQIQAQDTLNIVRRLLDDGDVSLVEKVQSLWSDFGHILRVFSPRLQRPVIVKTIQPPAEFSHPRGWNTSASKSRKLQSYQVEWQFYRNFAGLCPTSCRVPGFIAGEQMRDNHLILLLEDMDASGFAVRTETRATDTQLTAMIDWLAAFHARFLNQSPDVLWPEGTYWYLATRKEEYDNLPDSALKAAAGKLDNLLVSCQYQSLVHGDAKLANGCFSPDCAEVCMVDFQYVGGGVGVRDLAYLLGCCLDNEALFSQEEIWLSHYFSRLIAALHIYHPDVDGPAVADSWEALYPVAWADFHRFLAGWSPGHWKINPYMKHMTSLALEKI